MVCASFNDAAQSLAVGVSGALSDFVELMNKKARELGMNNTFYSDVSGMSNSSKTTVSDTVKLVQRLLSHETYINIASTKSYQLSDYATCEYNKITNRSSLMTSYKGLANLNVGSTENDGDNAVSYYNNGKLSFITIVMGAVPSNPKETENIAEKYTKSLLNHALYDNSLQTVLSKNQAVAYLPVKYTITDEKVGVYLAEDLKVYVPNDTTDDDNISINYYLYDDLKAPLKAGDEVGVVTVSLNSRFLTSAPLYINKTVERNAILYIIESAQDFLLSGTFLLILLSFALLLVLYYFYRMKFFDRMYGRYTKKKKRYINK
jgi:D-alanyl-D-alanine carboxypeptidase (penicillin-binding protein 5/6)